MTIFQEILRNYCHNLGLILFRENLFEQHQSVLLFSVMRLNKSCHPRGERVSDASDPGRSQYHNPNHGCLDTERWLVEIACHKNTSRRRRGMMTKLGWCPNWNKTRKCAGCGIKAGRECFHLARQVTSIKYLQAKSSNWCYFGGISARF